MKYLLDTHIILWALSGSKKLSPKVRKLISDEGNDIYISIVSPWEVEIKHDRFPEKMPLDSDELLSYCSMAGFKRLSIRPGHISLLKDLDQGIHADPFDRILICQAKAEDMILITHDDKIAQYGMDQIMKV